ncbi:DUF2206 domain-containing protein [Methanobacterium paludis]|uniref:DUF2206 domain-containing protein n=1 Tax=Methanobacterium paludis (strain DSM 25820 / JCM 18151 / SWAN1) TaxID=868131 RepID=F6D712_METPW|nr:DUF2206 domain-containing protein [Methanobacterium paludis]AEG18379.1 Protein of unknown function DUF2206, membrane [Methanobacterium paludis]
MQIDNVFQMNDWEINKFLKVIFAIQISVLSLVLLDSLGLNLLILGEIISVIYLLFVPGVLILRILKMHKLGSVESLLYSVGLSIASIMFIGFIINLVYPLLKISNPISMVPLIITMTLFVTVLSVFSYLRDKDFSEPSFIDTDELLSPVVLFLSLFPFLAIFGTYLMNWHKINIVLMLLIILICITLLLFAYGKIPKKFYPFTIFIVAISLLFHTSLISNYVTGWDIQNEYYLANIVIKNAVWNFKINSIVNAMLSITLLAPIISIITKINLNWVFKIIYPLIFSFVPVGLYKIFQKQTNEKIAFLSCFLFMSIYVFYTEMIGLARQEIAEFFLVLLIMLMINRRISNPKRSLLFIIFGVSLVISHYGLSYIYMFSLIVVYMLILLFDRYDIQKLLDFSFRNKNKNHVIAFKENMNYQIISSTFVIFFITFTIAWYMYVSNSAPLTTILNIGNHIASSISTDFLNPNAVQGLSVIQNQIQSPLHRLSKYIYLIIQFFIVIGVLTPLFKRNRMNFDRNYLLFVLVNFVILVAAVTVPFFASSLNVERLYQITLIFLAPFCIIGGLTIFKFIFGVIFKSSLKNKDSFHLKLISIFLVVFLLFNVGFMYYVFDDDSSSMALNTTYDTANYNQEEFYGVEWLDDFGSLSKFGNISTTESISISDDNRRPLLRSFGIEPVVLSRVYGNNSTVSDLNTNLMKQYSRYNSVYFFFGSKNVNDNVAIVLDKEGVNLNVAKYKNLTDLFDVENKIYDNGGSQLYYDVINKK